MKALFKQLRTILILLISIQLSIQASAQVSSLNFEVTLTNLTVPSSSEVSLDDVVKYTVTIQNIGSQNVQNALLIGFIPAGTKYVTNSTRLNGISILDVAGNFPYAGAGKNIQANGFATGIIPAGFTVTVEYQVKVTANGGNIHNYAYLEGMINSVAFNENSSTVYTTILPDANCATIYQSVGSTYTSRTYNQIRVLNTTNGTVGTSIIPNTWVYNAADTNSRFPNGTKGLSSTSAIAIDRRSQRLYFVNNETNANLCYIGLNRASPRQYCFANTPLSTTMNINRMTFSSDGWGYAITSDNTMLTRFKQDPVTDALTIEHLGALINDANNITVDIHDEAGGDIFGDGSGNLYLIANSNNLYKINPNNRISTFLGTVDPMPGGTSHSIAIDKNGDVYIGGNYHNIMKINLTTMEGTYLSTSTGTNKNIYISGDFASCNFPVISPVINATKTWKNLSREGIPRGGDTVEYTIEIINTGNLNAAGVKVYDSVPSLSAYVSGSTKLNGIAVADVSGQMPFSVTGGLMVNSPGQQPGIIRPSAEHKAVLQFSVVVQPLQIICNQSRVFLLDVNNDVIHVNSKSDDPNNPQSSTCFFTDGVLSDIYIDFQHTTQQNKNLLKWKVDEPNLVKKYELELSKNGYDFYTIHTVENNNQNSFEYLDQTAVASSIRYYRIKVTRTSGEAQYSVILRVQNPTEENLKIINNPVQDQLNFQFSTSESGIYNIRVIDLSGAIVQQDRVAFNTGIQVKSIKLSSHLKKGMYILEINNGKGHSQTKKFIKQ